MANTTYLLIGIGSLVTSVAALGVSLYGAVKMGKAAKTLDASVDDLVNHTVVDIPDSVIETATRRAVDKAADRVATRAAESIKHEFDDDIRSAVKDAVRKQNETLNGKIKDEINKRVGYIDISDVKDEVIREAKKETADRLSKELDGIKADYNQHLNDIKDIYSSIAKDMKSAAI